MRGGDQDGFSLWLLELSELVPTGNSTIHVEGGDTESVTERDAPATGDTLGGLRTFRPPIIMGIT